MDLYEEALEECVYINEAIVDDGYGGQTKEYSDGAHFRAAIDLDTTTEARIAEKQGITAIYSIYTPKAVNLRYPQIFKRVSDGKIFRVTSDGDDSHTPASAQLDMRLVSAEEYTLPSGSGAGG